VFLAPKQAVYGEDQNMNRSGNVTCYACPHVFAESLVAFGRFNRRGFRMR
jgi:hypothetical protein